MPLQQLVELMQEELFQKAPLITEQRKDNRDNFTTSWGERLVDHC